MMRTEVPASSFAMVMPAGPPPMMQRSQFRVFPGDIALASSNMARGFNDGTIHSGLAQQPEIHALWSVITPSKSSAVSADAHVLSLIRLAFAADFHSNRYGASRGRRLRGQRRALLFEYGLQPI